MSVLSCQPPSVIDLLNLGSLVSNRTMQASKTKDLLKKMFDLCQTDWVSNFLFTSDPIHPNLLASEVLFNTSLVAELATTRVESPRLQPNPSPMGESHYVFNRLLIVPTFTAGHLTVGIGVMEYSRTSGLLTHPEYGRRGRHKFCNYRFVRDARTRKFLVVMDIPGGDAFSVYYSVHGSPTLCHSATALFRKSSFLQCLNEAKKDVVSTATLTLLSITEEHYFRRCQICHQTHAMNCGCVQPNLPPAHPFDFSRFQTELAGDCGLFEGFSRRSLVSHSGQTTVSFGSSVCLQLIVNDKLRKRLRGWSLQSQLSVGSEDPRASHQLNTTFGDRKQETELLSGNVGNAFSIPMPDLLEGCCEESSDVNADIKQNDQTDALDIPLPENASAEKVRSSLKSFPTEALTENKHDFFREGPAMARPTESEGWWNQFERQDISLLPEIYGSAAEPVSEGVTSPTVNTLFNQNGTAEQLPSLTKPDQEANRQADAVALERQRKLEARKERNRASARRSNIRNKELKAAIREEMKVLVGRVETLRSRELRLRQQNLSLRRLLAVKNVSDRRGSIS
ncbi:unnamed protein product [Chondrus crispus]|uniref:BZIP domain-containing protein n=1 Tax=Chondrus crispus TaxID=2769 RepID=R7Q9E6_CHOCR|nr:unnamed protein product [Chondrus crispus]CDF35162.1 unnamed protein product [Chondrus crispus]|eukprot:XP_005714981.1 unnamed protein product [Chondrus crispus]